VYSGIVSPPAVTGAHWQAVTQNNMATDSGASLLGDNGHSTSTLYAASELSKSVRNALNFSSNVRVPFVYAHSRAAFSRVNFHLSSRIAVTAMTGAAIAIKDASAADSILSVKERVFAVNSQLPVHRQRLVYRPGPRGMEPLADDETLGGAGVAQDGSAELDLLLAEMTAAEVKELGQKVCRCGAPRVISCEDDSFASVWSSFVIYQHCFQFLTLCCLSFAFAKSRI
jgi:hypothetical protein